MRLKFSSVIALLPLLLGACQPERTDGPAPTATKAPAEVTVVTLQPEPVTLTRELPGRSTPYLVAEVRPQVTGIVRRRLFTEGAKVEAGQPLYELDDSTYRADYDRAKAVLARAKATAKLARVNAERSADLARSEAVSRQENETAVATLAQTEADVAVAQAAVTGAEVLLGYATIRSPIGGRIGRSSITQGALVTANQSEPLATVQQLDPIYVDLTQSSRELLDLRRDFSAGTLQRPDEMPVTILLEDGTRYQKSGKLAFAEVTVDPSTGSFALRVVVPNRDEILLPGMYVRAIVTTGTRENALLVPQRGIARDPKGNATAMVVGQDGKVAVRPVQVSRTLGDKWLVESGLAAGDKVVVEGLQKIQPGTAVQATEAPSSASSPSSPSSTSLTSSPSSPSSRSSP